ncbi:MAG: anaerobic ribonucleoside-triphosphate reductase activating protein [Clostridium sp.]
MDTKLRLSGIAYESLVNGPGIRRVFFAQGCTHNCENCFNKDTHDLNGGKLVSINDLIKDIDVNPMITGVTFSGGDPLEQGEEFAKFAKEIKDRNLSIWCYTGYTIEYILSNLKNKSGWEELINNIDVLVDGKFEEEHKVEGLRFKGSTNQRIIDVKKSLQEGEVVILT